MLVESVPNVSEGRRLDVVDRLADAITAVGGVALLDRTSDASHNRSVFTMAGEHGPVCDALERLVGVAIHDIDMDAHEGEHPRIGAVDVIPFIPLGPTTMAACIDLARAFG
ncbi:MAG: glutamate formimidoyltransferase, partial [Candidatus Limnocylindrales bacterium]